MKQRTFLFSQLLRHWRPSMASPDDLRLQPGGRLDLIWRLNMGVGGRGISSGLIQAGGRIHYLVPEDRGPHLPADCWLKASLRNQRSTSAFYTVRPPTWPLVASKPASQRISQQDGQCLSYNVIAQMWSWHPVSFAAVTWHLHSRGSLVGLTTPRWTPERTPQSPSAINDTPI